MVISIQAPDYASLYADEVMAHAATRRRINDATWWFHQARQAACNGRADLAEEFIDIGLAALAKAE